MKVGIIRAIPAWLVDGLPEQEVRFLLSCVGHESEIIDTLYDGTVEIMLTDESEGIIHFLMMDPSDLETVSEA